MSTENGVYILETNFPERGKTQFRVAHARTIENIELEADYPTPDHCRLNRHHVLRIFGDSPVFDNIADALLCAKQVYKEKTANDGIVEYGICFLDFSDVFFPNRKKRSTPRRRKANLALAA